MEEEVFIAGELIAEVGGNLYVFRGFIGGGLEAVDFGVGEGVVLEVEAGGFAEGGGGGGEVEDIVGDLEGEAEVEAEFVAEGDVFGCGAGDFEAACDGGGDEGGGFVFVDEVEFFFVGGGVVGMEVLDLAADEVGGACGEGEVVDEVAGEIGGIFVVFGEEEEGVGEEGVAGEDGGGFVEFDMACGEAAAEGTVVHAGKVVVDEGVGVEAFDGDSGWHGVGFKGVELVGGEEEDGPEAFSSGFEGVEHGLVDFGRGGVGGWEELFYRLINLVLVVV